jgi:hypothetical protein
VGHFDNSWIVPVAGAQTYLDSSLADYEGASGFTATSFITRMYQQVLGRDPDQVGMGGWMQHIQQGGSVVPTVFGFFHSNEFMNRHMDDDDFLRICYQVFMDRDPDPSGFAAFRSDLRTGLLTRDNILDIFMDSEEFAAHASFLPPLTPMQDFMTNLYVRILGRGPDSAGMQAWIAQLQQMHQALPIIQAFLASPEFQSRQMTNTEFVTLMYRVFMDRIPDPQGMAGSMAMMNQGMQMGMGITALRNQMMTQFAASPEFQAIQQRLLS